MNRNVSKWMGGLAMAIAALYGIVSTAFLVFSFVSEPLQAKAFFSKALTYIVEGIVALFLFWLGRKLYWKGTA